MTGTLWEADIWRPHLARRMEAVAVAHGVSPSHLTPDLRDEIVLGSLDVLPVPVLQFAYTPVDGREIDLGWVGESLERLEGAGRVSRLRTAEHEFWMRRGADPARRQEQERV